MERALPESLLTVEAVRRALSGRTARKHPESGRPASVLVPLFERDHRLHVLLTKRTEQLAQHAGQFSFPGGKRDPGDLNAQATALRETQEEIGLDPSAVEILGELDDCPTFVTNFVITPIVGLIPDGYAFVPSTSEIAFLLEAPIGDFLAPGALRVEQARRGDFEFTLYFYTVKGHVVWGATARILTQLFELLAGDEGEPWSPNF